MESHNIYAEINDVPMNIRFFCTPCCSVISSILEMHVALDNVTSSITAKLSNLEDKVAKSLDDVSNKLSHQLQEIQAKLSTTDNFKKVLKILKSIN